MPSCPHVFPFYSGPATCQGSQFNVVLNCNTHTIRVATVLLGFRVLKNLRAYVRLRQAASSATHATWPAETIRDTENGKPPSASQSVRLMNPHSAAADAVPQPTLVAEVQLTPCSPSSPDAQYGSCSRSKLREWWSDTCALIFVLFCGIMHSVRDRDTSRGPCVRS
ncbi:uncharacterized protein DEA37_0007978 [Paragonimus westermani]|uniref:Uncharacterized protein n=1 Tax=Paragonimus westermani TaxID=34504 RepID=A0A5J4NPB0_9TREM|nr:uncharacterized protein DEA37_0007978 [Paragonimus westermani]